MSEPIPTGRLPPLAVACLLVVVQSGCTTALTTAYLREGLWRGAEHAAASEPADRHGGVDAESDTTSGAPNAIADSDQREAALGEAMSRLSRLGTLDPAAEAALVATLQRTEPEDWPVVVEEFAATLATAETTIAMKPTGSETAGQDPAEEPVATAEPAAVAEETVPEPAPKNDVADGAPVTASAAAPAGDAEPPPPATASSVDAPAAEPPLAVRAACFASAVRAWGDVDRYAADRFRPGQEVIVYVELDNLATGTSPAGHTTCIDAFLRLVDGTDRTIHTWTFEPIAETSVDRRRDYFARYVVRIPDSVPPGGCRVEMAVTDTLAGATAAASLPLEIVAVE